MKRSIYGCMLFFALAGFRNSSDRTISGTVYDQASKQPLAGVLVSVVGAKDNGIRTNSQGKYAINVAPQAAELIFSTIGYVSQQISIGKSDKLDVWLKAVGNVLNEVVVVGYGTQKRESISGSVQAIAAESNSGIRIRGVSMSRRPTGFYPMPQAETESYKGVKENGFISPLKEALSTFAVDVDAASYSNVRRFINQGQLPPQDAVRIEEMINYFQYDLPGPKGDEPVAILTELSTAPWNAQHQLLRIGLKAKAVPTEKLPASNLVFLIDVSGSMFDSNKLPLVKSSLKLLVDQLRATDHVAIVTYAGSAGLKLPSTPGDQKMKIKDAIDALEAGGSTAGGAGIKMAYQQARQNLSAEGTTGSSWLRMVILMWVLPAITTWNCLLKKSVKVGSAFRCLVMVWVI